MAFEGRKKKNAKKRDFGNPILATYPAPIPNHRRISARHLISFRRPIFSFLFFSVIPSRKRHQYALCNDAYTAFMRHAMMHCCSALFRDPCFWCRVLFFFHIRGERRFRSSENAWLDSLAASREEGWLLQSFWSRDVESRKEALVRAGKGCRDFEWCQSVLNSISERMVFSNLRLLQCRMNYKNVGVINDM